MNTTEIFVAHILGQASVIGTSTKLIMRKSAGETMNADQVKILSERVVVEVFTQVFSLAGEQGDDGIAVIGWPRLSEEELSRRLDVAIRISTEKFATFTPA